MREIYPDSYPDFGTKFISLFWEDAGEEISSTRAVLAKFHVLYPDCGKV